MKPNQLKLSLKSITVPIDEKLERDMEYSIALIACIKDVQSPSNFDGTYNLKFIAEPTGELIVSTKVGKHIVVKGDKRSQSRKLFYEIIQRNDTDMDDKEFYKMKMSKLIENIDTIMEDL
jgi:hypothetical protein